MPIDDEPPNEQPDDPLDPDDPLEGDNWAVDTALGVASIFARTANAVGSSIPGRLAAGATKRLSRPLAKEGHEVREQIEEDAGPAAKRIMAQVTPRVVDVVDVDSILGAIDIDAILNRIDIDAILNRIDLNALMERIDIDALLDRIDVGAIIDKVDINGIVEKLDIDSLVQNTEIGGIIAKSTSGMASSALDMVRSQGVGLDGFVERWVNRLTRRDPSTLPEGPTLLVEQAPLALPPGDQADVA